DGAPRTFSITVAKLEDESVAETESETPSKVRWGLGLQDLTPDDRKQLGLGGNAGVGVANVAPGSPAEEAGVEAGDVVLEGNRHPGASRTALVKEGGKTRGGR